MIVDRTGQRACPRKGLGGLRIGAAIVITLGAVYGIVSIVWEIPASSAELVFPTAALIGGGILFRNRAFVSSVFSAAVAVILLVSTLIVTETAFPQVVLGGLLVDPLKSRALHALLTFSCILSFIVLIWSPVGWSWMAPTRREQSFAKTSLWPALFASQVLASLSVRGPLITRAAYWSDDYAKSAGKQDVGIESLGLFLMVYSIIAALRGYGVKHLYFKCCLIVVLLSIVYFRLLRGERASVIGFVVILTILYYWLSDFRYKAFVVLSTLILGFAFVRIWAVVRWEMAFVGFSRSMGMAFSSAGEMIEVGATDDRFSEAFWYLLQTVNLYETGVRRHGMTYLNLIPQMIPEGIASVVGFERPLSEPWVLAQYVQHGGGIFIVAEAYWNFGLVGVIGLAAALGWSFVGLERLYRRVEPFHVYAYLGFIMLNVVSLTVGIQSLVRGLEIGLLVTGLGWLLMRIPSTNGRRISVGG